MYHSNTLSSIHNDSMILSDSFARCPYDGRTSNNETFWLLQNLHLPINEKWIVEIDISFFNLLFFSASGIKTRFIDDGWWTERGLCLVLHWNKMRHYSIRLSPQSTWHQFYLSKKKKKRKKAAIDFAADKCSNLSCDSRTSDKFI